LWAYYFLLWRAVVTGTLEQLILAIVSGVTERGGYVTKTKLLKLLYLFDVEYYRVHRRTFTGFPWKFFHLGPWARDFDPVLQQLTSHNLLLASVSTKYDDTSFYRTADVIDPGTLFNSFSDEALLRSVLNTWSESSTAEILDHVYFHTEPMQHGIRNEPLDFAVIKPEKPERYKRENSGISEKELQRLRRKFRERVAARLAGSQKFNFTRPRYDDEFVRAMEKLEAGDL